MLPLETNFSRFDHPKSGLHRRADGAISGTLMSCFQCSKCGCVEDTALCHYWSACIQETAPVCSACDPKIGKWHGEFPRQSLAQGGWVREKHGFLLWNKREIERWLGQSIEIIGKTF